MKKLSFFSILVLCLGVSGLLTAKDLSNTQTPAEIIVIIPDAPGSIPRVPAQIPIQGMVLGNTIYLAFQCDLGDIDVELYKDGSGLVWQTSVDSSELSVMLPFNGSSGDYTLAFTTSGGAVYEGSFSIE